MSARGVDFLELWIERNVLPRSADRDQALRLAMKLESDAVAENLTLGELEIPSGESKHISETSSSMWANRERRAIELLESGRVMAEGTLLDSLAALSVNVN